MSARSSSKSANAAPPRRRCSNSTRREIWYTLGRTRRTVTNGPSRITAFTSITKAMCGSAAMARKMLTCSSSRRKASSCCRSVTMEKTAAAMIRRTSAASPRSGSIRKPMKRTSRTVICNKRVAVLDADTGKMKRYWGAYGNKPDDANLGKYDPEGAAGAAVPQSGALRRAQLTTGCSTSAIGGRPRAGVSSRRHICKGSVLRQGNAGLGLHLGHRILEGRRSRNTYFLPTGPTRRCASYCARRLQELTNFGDGGRQPGQFYGVHSIATDSKGNVYTTETYEGKRLQKFVFKGVQQVPAGGQGTPWASAR